MFKHVINIPSSTAKPKTKNSETKKIRLWRKRLTKQLKRQRY